MNKIETGGPAFPLSHSHKELSGTDWQDANGMTLRDYFAAKAMQAIIAKAPFGTEEAGAQLDRQMLAARGAYAYADAMLAARDHSEDVRGMGGGWIEWKGGPMPVHGDTVVVVRFRGSDNEYERDACSLDWYHMGGISDIIAYRIVGGGKA
jgi:hypothetical protein